jgi:hypothetical protein
MTSCRFALQLRWDVGGPTWAVAAVAVNAMAKTGSRILIMMFSYRFDRNDTSVVVR